MKKVGIIGLSIASALLIALIVVVVLVLTFFAMMFLGNDAETEYAKSSQWNCDNQSFDTAYVDFYKNKVSEIKEKYSLNCEEEWYKESHDDDSIITAYLYNDQYTIYILFANRGICGDFTVKMFYYGDGKEAPGNDGVQSSLISFVHDLTKSVAFDSRTDDGKNHFEQLYNECLEENKPAASYVYHFDELVGYIGYTVGLSKDNYGYYYKMQKDSNIKIPANAFKFQGLLKPIQ